MSSLPLPLRPPLFLPPPPPCCALGLTGRSCWRRFSSSSLLLNGRNFLTYDFSPLALILRESPLLFEAQPLPPPPLPLEIDISDLIASPPPPGEACFAILLGPVEVGSASQPALESSLSSVHSQAALSFLRECTTFKPWREFAIRAKSPIRSCHDETISSFFMFRSKQRFRYMNKLSAL